MTVQSYAGRAPRPSSLADVLELVLDKGLVIDAYVRVSLVGIELLTIAAKSPRRTTWVGCACTPSRATPGCVAGVTP